MPEFFCIVSVLVALYIFICSGRTFASMLFTLTSGVFALAVIFIATKNGLPFAVFTPLTVGAAALYGIPGVIGILILRIIGIF